MWKHGMVFLTRVGVLFVDKNDYIKISSLHMQVEENQIVLKIKILSDHNRVFVFYLLCSGT